MQLTEETAQELLAAIAMLCTRIDVSETVKEAQALKDKQQAELVASFRRQLRKGNYANH